MSENISKTQEINEISNDTSKDNKFRYKAGVFLAGVSGLSAIIGFGATLASVKKADPRYFDKGIVGSLEMGESAASLAMRALGWGTVYAFAGCGVLFFSIWKLSGAENLQEFRSKMGEILPAIPKNNPPRGRTEFTGMNDLLDYLQNLKSDKDKK